MATSANTLRARVSHANHPTASSSASPTAFRILHDNQLFILLLLLILLPLLSLLLIVSLSLFFGSISPGFPVSDIPKPVLIPHATDLKILKNSGIIRQRRMQYSRRQLQFLPFPPFPTAPAPPPVRQPPPGTTVSSTNITAQLSFNASATTTTNSPNPVAVTTPTPGGVTAISPNTTGGPAATGAGPHGSLFPPVFPNPVTTAGGALLGAVGGPTTGALAGAAAGAAAASGEGNATGAGGAGQGAGVTGSGTTMVAVPSPAVLQQPPPLILPPAQQQQLTPPLPPAQQGAGTAGGGFPGFSAAPAGNFAAGAVLGSALGAAAGTAAAAAGSAVASAAQSAAPTPPQIPPPQQQQVQSPAPSAAAVTPGGIVNETLNAVGELSGQGRVVMNGNEMQMQLRAGRGLQVVMGTQQLA